MMPSSEIAHGNADALISALERHAALYNQERSAEHAGIMTAVAYLRVFKAENTQLREKLSVLTPCENYLAPHSAQNPTDFGECAFCEECGFFKQEEANALRQLREMNKSLIEAHRGQCAYCQHSQMSSVKRYKYINLRTCDFIGKDGLIATNFEKDCKHWTFKLPLQDEIVFPDAVTEKSIIKQYRRALAAMRFAYFNKDADCPHQFENRALKLAARLIGPVDDDDKSCELCAECGRPIENDGSEG